MEKGYLFPTVSTIGEGGTAVRGSLPLVSKPNDKMAALLQQSAGAVGVQGDFSMNSFRLGAAVSRASAGDDLPTSMRQACWENPKTVWSVAMEPCS